MKHTPRNIVETAPITLLIVYTPRFYIAQGI